MFDLADASVPDIKPHEFAHLKAFAQDTFGLDLRSGKERLVCARLGKHIRAGGFKTFKAYFEFVQQDQSGASLVALIDALTTNHTSFLREPEHFKFLTGLVAKEPARRINIWSAACSTGEEPYSILFTALEALGGKRGSDLRIAATDISSRVLAIAREGKYLTERVSALPPDWVRRYFRRENKTGIATYQVSPEFRQHIEFRRLNLMDNFPAGFAYSVIFCRNVMIYFNKKTQEDLVNRLARTLEPGGYLLVGHAESLTGINHPLKYVQPAVYQRTK